MSATRAGGPPRLAEWLIARRLRRNERPMVLGDLHEQFGAHVRTFGAARATRWYWREAGRLAWGLWWWTPHPARPRGTLMTFDDLRYAVRRLKKRPVAAVISIMTLGCAIGAAAATWSLVSAVLLHPLQLPDPEHLVQVGYRYDWPSGPETMTGYTYPTYAALRAAALMPVAASGSIGSSTPLLIQGAGQARAGSIIFASHDLLKLLGLHVSLGRFFGESEDQRGAPLVAVLSDRFWRSEFNEDPRVIGRLIRVREQSVTVVGVAPIGFHGFEVGRVPDLFMPLNAIDQVQPYPGLYGDRPPVHWIDIVGRLPEGVTSAEMAARLNGLHVGLPADNKGFVLTAVETAALSEESRADIRQFSRLLGATVAMLLAVGSITVGMLLLLRTEARSGELAMCLALGASRARLAAGIAVEGMLLAAAGAALGLPVSRMLFAGIRAFELPGNIRVDRLDLSIDARVLAGAAAAAVASVLLMAAVASLFGVRRDLGDVLRSHAGVTPRLTRRRSRSALVTAQVAVTLVLVTGAGLFARSVVRALSLNPGVDTDRLFETRLDLNGYGYDGPRSATFLEALSERLAVQPAVASVGVFDEPNATKEIQVDGEARRLPSFMSEIWIDTRYLGTIGRPVSAGRPFTATDRAGTPSVAIVNASLAKLIASHGSPIGHRIDLADLVAVSAEVIGVVPDVMVSPGELKPLRLYMPFAQQPALRVYPGSGGHALLVRATGDVPAAIAAVTAVVRDLDPQMHLRPMSTFDDLILDQMAAQRFGMTVMGALGAIALLLSVLGIYVLVESMGTLRRREIGIRASLGARSDQLRMVLLSETFRLVGAGLVLGFVLAWLGAGTIRAFLFEVEPFDPLVTGSVAAVIAALAILVSLRPVWAAARVDLVRVLRED
jgi:predicted permease